MSETKIQKLLHANLGEVPLDEMVLDNVEEGFFDKFIINQGSKAFKNGNYLLSKTFLFSSALSGLKEAQYILGLHYINGYAGKPNLAKALMYLELASKQNYPVASYTLSHLYNLLASQNQESEESKQSFLDLRNKYILEAANSDYPSALFVLGTFYEDGSIGTRDFSTALALYQSAADKGHEKAIARLRAYSSSGRRGNRRFSAKKTSDKLKNAANRMFAIGRDWIGW